MSTPLTRPTVTNPRWKPSAAIWASTALHGAVFASCIIAPTSWPLGVGALAANHAGLTAAGLWPRSRLLGPNIRRLNKTAISNNKIALTFDDGPNPQITPWVLDILDRYSTKATFFCIGQSVSTHKALARQIVARGHAIENHSQHHAHAFSTFGLSRLRTEIETAQKTIADTVGILPSLFRAPAGLRSPLLEPVLAPMGLRLVSWTRRGFDTVEINPDKVFARLTKKLQAGDILLLHDGNPGYQGGRNRSASGNSHVEILLDRLLTTFSERDLQSVAITHALIA
jgi:peptidoglycan-N-acetylglucosamine deacetylase